MTTGKRLAAGLLALLLGALLLASAAHDHPGHAVDPVDHCAICAAVRAPAGIVEVAGVVAPAEAVVPEERAPDADEHHAFDDLLPARAPPLS